MFSKPEDNFRGTSSYTSAWATVLFETLDWKLYNMNLPGLKRSFSPNLPNTNHFICTSLNKRKPRLGYASFFGALPAFSIYFAHMVILSALILYRGYKGSDLRSVRDCNTRLSAGGRLTLTARLIT